ncbi:tRNA (adenosine(37)-N6)-threonylcarbamoyltransferase complex ATPase subunit type 1 TsaE [Allosphingosinicella flava]|uniref:tRNA threonylcarbamoyladenosine biosynthesis protein TsaE n=1 Tax=Allosphingosinicella flava TaxID=2771430 RepID=A0A7T2GL18_9SPHN|nr:tRNA (adenosine(37)-N6)-threonylcarbamoyltransferase complex ATPase subunit type 1 TsaE [Sphingosinicella flava]QPQ55782.1 tRNA (adenosine(37)-N6)-threonylcarbamoyltransferase complex ATPase subunit type 1 TsaE [Sphingosinicella flava]
MIRLAGEGETEALGGRLAAVLRPGDVVALHGDLGAGKTAFARGVLRGLDFAGDVASPTFPIVQVYEVPDLRFPVWHVDLYRIEDSAELEELALDDARHDAALLIEWPERLGAALWPDSLQLFLDRDGEDARALTASVPPAWEGRWPLP